MGERAVARAAVVAVVGLSVVAFTARAAASDATLAKTLLIVQADVGSDYTAVKINATDPTGFGRLADCVGKPVPNRTVTARRDGHGFVNKANGDAVLSSVDIVKTTAEFKADRKVFGSPKLADCVRQLTQDAIGTDRTILYVNTQSAAVLRRHFGKTFLYALDTQIRQADGTPLHVLDMTLGKGRAEVEVQMQTKRDTVDIAQLEAAFDPVNDRLKKAKL